jgi:hypothetical protein
MRAEDVRLAFRIVWAVVSGGILLVLLAPFLLRAETVARWTPACTRPPCILCGMTTSFLAISRGDFDAARDAHQGGIPLYAAFAGNEALLATYLFRRVRLCRFSA